ncbi:exonuclease domain-containing protein [Streptomyces noboritoensis]|uniref:Exonuclease domain-containing protein n=1 Tax=Streptomyces noboritoensis TaxID=67337 RepID=A0ABV6TGA3_9ACTN
MNNPHPADLFTTVVDTIPVDCIRPHDSDATWVVYQHGRHHPHHILGVLRARTHTDGHWYVQHTGEHHPTLADAIRTLRRPTAWPHHRNQAITWARRTLADPSLLLIDIQTTGLHHPYALEIAVLHPNGHLLINETLNPQSPIDPHATALHGHTRHTTAHAPTFSDLLPRLTQALRHQHCLAYNTPFDHHVLHRELHRHYHHPAPTHTWLNTIRWSDALPPIATWTGRWSARHHTYRYPPLTSHYNAAANCHTLLDKLHRLAQSDTRHN